MLDAEGKELQWNRGYKYFGASKDLPGVKEGWLNHVLDYLHVEITDKSMRIESSLYFGVCFMFDFRILFELAAK